MFETVHLKTHTLEYNFGACRVGNLFDDGCNLSGVQGWRWEKDVELCRKQPERCNVELTGLKRGIKTGDSKLHMATNQLHNGANGALNVNSVVAKYSNKTSGTTDRWKLDECCVIAHDCLEIFGTVGHHPVQLPWENCSISGNDALTLTKSNRVRGWKQNHDNDMPCSVIVEAAYPAHAGPRKIRLRYRQRLCAVEERYWAP
jgi:hypothetical protein